MTEPYCEKKANTFLNDIFTLHNIETNLDMVKQKCEVLATASLLRGIGGSDPSDDTIGKYIRFIHYWFENNEDIRISNDFNAVKSLR